MESIEDRLNYNKKQLKRIFENEQVLALNARKMFTEESPEEYHSSDGKVHFFKNGTNTTITNSEDKDSDNGVYISVNPNLVIYSAQDSGNRVFSGLIMKVEDNYFISTSDSENKANIFKGIIEGDTLLDVIEKMIKENSKEKDIALEVFFNDFKALLYSLGRENLTYETDEEIIIRKLLEENEQLKKENLSLKEKFKKVRFFITERCSKIPFFGEKLLKEIQNELGENQLQSPKDKEER